MNIYDFLSRLKNVSKCSGGWKACCPAHNDRSSSLSITEGNDGRILIKCHAGCTAQQVVAAMNLTMSDLFPESTDTQPSLGDFSPEFYSRNRSSYPWEPDAECPRFLNELLKPALSTEDILLLQKYAGQCLLGRNASQTLLLIRGTAGGGKSTLCEIIEKVIGEENVAQLRVEQLTNRFETLRFQGRTLLSGKDVAGNFLDSKGAYMLKALVGGDRMEGEVKGGNLSFAMVV